MPSPKSPRIVILAGPNGAGKTTSSAKLLHGELGVSEFVNADVIARGLSAFAPENVAFEAGRVMLNRLKELAAQRQDFAFETTLASRSYARWLKQLQGDGYEVMLAFFWLPSAEVAISRVAYRVQLGGHHVPDDIIRRRYVAGLKNLQNLYIPLANSWYVIDNRTRDQPVPIADGKLGAEPNVQQPELWREISKVR